MFSFQTFYHNNLIEIVFIVCSINIEKNIRKPMQLYLGILHENIKEIISVFP